MNMKKLLAIFACLISGTLLLSSCHDDEEVYNPKESPIWGYFEGAINGEKKSFKNTVYDRYVERMECKRIVVGEPISIKGSCIGIDGLSDEPGRYTGVAIMLINPEIGTRYIINNPSADFYDYDYDGVISRDIKQGSTHYFQPKADKPVKVEITSIEYKEDGRIRAIEGEIDGVVYLQQDSIAIKGKFGTR